MMFIRLLLPFVVISALLLNVSSCGPKIRPQDDPHSTSLNEKASIKDLKKLELQNQEEEFNRQNGRKANHYTYAILTSPEKFQEAINQLEAITSESVIFSDKELGYIHFEALSTTAKKMLEYEGTESFLIDYSIPFDKNLKELKDQADASPEGQTTDATTPTIERYPREVMLAQALIDSFKNQYGVTLDGSNATVVVADTGLDITRTDAFQDRIVGLYTVRAMDSITLTKATIKDID